MRLLRCEPASKLCGHRPLTSTGLRNIGRVKRSRSCARKVWWRAGSSRRPLELADKTQTPAVLFKVDEEFVDASTSEPED